MKHRLSVRRIWTAVIWLGCVGASAWGQDSTSAGDSLGAVARQTRAQHASSADGKPSKAQEIVDEMQQEQEAADNAPVGFKNYDAGDYRLFVPYPFSLEGRDNGGAVLLGSRLGITTTEVMAGAPIPIRPHLSDADLASLVSQMARRYSSGAYCSPIPGTARKTFQCSLGTTSLLGRTVMGDMEYVVGSNSLIPVMCVSPQESNQCLTYDSYGYRNCYNRYLTWEESQRAKGAVQARYSEQRTTTQMCQQVIYPSIQLKEDIVVHPASISEKKTPRMKTATTTQEGEPGSQGTSLAELARRTRQASQGKPQATLDNAEGAVAAPPGFQSFVLQYCQNPQQCSEASVVIPEKTEVVSRTNGQHIFKTFLNGEPVMLYAGPADVNAPYRSLTDPDYIRMRDLANSNNWSREKADGVSTQEMTIVGKYSLMTRFRYQRDQKRWWIGERVLIQNRGGQFLLGCTAAEEHFADAEVLCTTLVNSLRLP
jgi:hypothetical protein